MFSCWRIQDRASAAPADFRRNSINRPFYSYLHIDAKPKSEELGKTFRNQTLSLCTDLKALPKSAGCSSIRRSAPEGSECCLRAAATIHQQQSPRSRPVIASFAA